jgi:hypothetical protein
MAGSLAAGMGELHRDGGSGMLAHRGKDRLQRRFRGVIPEPEATRRDAADRLHMGGLDAEHRSPRQRQRVDMRKMPVIGLAVHGRVLAHRRHHDAVGQFQAAQFYRGKQGAHGGFPDGRKGRRGPYLMKRGAFLNRLNLGFGMQPMQGRRILSSLREAQRRLHSTVAKPRYGLPCFARVWRARRVDCLVAGAPRNDGRQGRSPRPITPRTCRP